MRRASEEYHRGKYRRDRGGRLGGNVKQVSRKHRRHNLWLREDWEWRHNRLLFLVLLRLGGIGIEFLQQYLRELNTSLVRIDVTHVQRVTAVSAGILGERSGLWNKGKARKSENRFEQIRDRELHRSNFTNSYR